MLYRNFNIRLSTISFFLLSITGFSIAQMPSQIIRLSDDIFQLRFLEDAKEHITILQVTDQHLGKQGFWKQDLETCRRTAKLVEMYKSDLIAITGDLLTGEKYFGDLLVLYAMQFFDGFQIPLLYVFGNHDPEGGMGRDEIYDIFSASGWGMLGCHKIANSQRKYDYKIEILLPDD